jgi:hypothetical protein
MTDPTNSETSVPCSAFVLRLFPKPCIPRKRHLCRLCGTWIEAREPCCKWSGFDDPPWTSYAHPECYDEMKAENEQVWESLLPGDIERPSVRMYWPNISVSHGGTPLAPRTVSDFSLEDHE